MTPEEQLPLLLKAFEAIRRPSGPDFVAGNQTHAIADFRRAADKAGGEVGEVLHALLDAAAQVQVAPLRVALEKEREKVAALQAAARLARARITRVMKVAVTKRQTHIYQTLKEARDELVESS